MGVWGDNKVSSMTWVRTDWPKSGTYAIEAPAAISTDGINSFKFNDHLLVSASARFAAAFGPLRTLTIPRAPNTPIGAGVRRLCGGDHVQL